MIYVKEIHLYGKILLEKIIFFKVLSVKNYFLATEKN